MASFRFTKGNKFGKGITSAQWTKPMRKALSIKLKARWGLLDKATKLEHSHKVKAAMSRTNIKNLVKTLNKRPRRPMSEQHKTKISLALRGKIPPNMAFNNTYKNIQNGEYSINGVIKYFRSKWEANAALYLDYLKQQGKIKNWHYENKWFEFTKIRHGTTRYLPDFEVENLDGSLEYWEVKGYMDGRSKTKLKRMAKYYPKVKIVLLQSDFFKAIKKQHLDKLLKFY